MTFFSFFYLLLDTCHGLGPVLPDFEISITLGAINLEIMRDNPKS